MGQCCGHKNTQLLWFSMQSDEVEWRYCIFSKKCCMENFENEQTAHFRPLFHPFTVLQTWIWPPSRSFSFVRSTQRKNPRVSSRSVSKVLIELSNWRFAGELQKTVKKAPRKLRVPKQYWGYPKKELKSKVSPLGYINWGYIDQDNRTLAWFYNQPKREDLELTSSHKTIVRG
jgi:hypothetical protein